MIDFQIISTQFLSYQIIFSQVSLLKSDNLLIFGIYFFIQVSCPYVETLNLNLKKSAVISLVKRRLFLERCLYKQLFNKINNIRLCILFIDTYRLVFKNTCNH